MALRMAETFIVGLLGGIIAKKIKIPAPFMTGSMLAVALFSVLTEKTLMPSTFKIIAQIVSGAYIGQQVSKADLLNLPKIGKSILFLMLLFTFNMFAMGFVFHHFFQMDLVTALLSCMPGGIMDVSLISIDMGAESEIVATMQLSRLVGILLILPVWINFLLKHFGDEQKETSSNTSPKKLEKTLPIGTNRHLSNDLLILIVSGIGGAIGIYLGIPVGALIFSLIFSCLLKLTKNTAQLNSNIRYLAQILAGSIIGSTFTRHSMTQIHQLIVPATLLLLSYLFINVLFGVIIYKRGILDLKSALFASSPAGATDISLIAGELGGDMPKIAAIQISRTIYTIVVLPTLVQWFIQ